MGAFNQLQTYKQQIAALFQTNALLVTSDGITARVGSLSADLERFMPWRTTDGRAYCPGASRAADTDRRRVRAAPLSGSAALVHRFGETGSRLVKIIAGYHQYHAVNHAVDSTIRAAASSHELQEDPVHYGLPSVARNSAG